MVKNKTQNIVVLAATVIILHLNHYIIPLIAHHYFQHHLLNQTYPIPPGLASRTPNAHTYAINNLLSVDIYYCICIN